MRKELAQSKDPINYSKLPSPEAMAGMNTQEVTGPHPVYEDHAGAKHLLWLFGLTSVGGMFVYLVLRAILEQLGFLGVVGAGIVTALAGAHFLYKRKAEDWMIRTALLVPLPLFIVLALLTKLGYYPGLGTMTLGLPAFGLLLLLIHRATMHHALWYTALPPVNIWDRDKWRAIIRNRGEKADRRPYFVLMGLAVVFYILSIPLGVLLNGDPGRSLVFVSGLSFIAFHVLTHLRKLNYDNGAASGPLAALINFVGYNRHNTRAPGVWQSPYGTQFTRLVFAAVVLFLFSFSQAASMLGTNSPSAYVRVIGGAVLNGDLGAIVLTATFFLCPALFPITYIYVAHLIAAPRLIQIDTELGSQWFAGAGSNYANRSLKLLLSTQESGCDGKTIRETDHLTLGEAVAGDYPLLIPRQVIEEHVHILGQSGSGKTSRALAPLCDQLMHRGAVVFVDLKGSDDTLAAMHLSSTCASGTLKWLTLDPTKETFAWNPFLEPFFQRKDPAGRALYLVKALSLDSGEGYGRSYFSESNLNLLRLLLTEFPNAKSFRELSEAAQELKSFRAKTADEAEDARQVLMVIRTLAAIPQLNVTEGNCPPEVFENRIQLAELAKKRNLAVNELGHHLYFHLSALTNDMAGRHVARLLLFGLLAMSAERAPEADNHIYLAIDEAQRIATAETLEIVLQQSRSFGISTLLAHQSLGDLVKPGGDLTKTVINNTRLRICFGVAHPDDVKTLIAASAEAAYESPSWAVSDEDARSGRFASSRNINPHQNVSTLVGPRITSTDITRMSDNPELAWVNVQRGAGYAQFGGEPLIARLPYYIDPWQFKMFKETPWPTAKGTFVAEKLEAVVETPMELPGWLAGGIPNAAPLPALPVLTEVPADNPFAMIRESQAARAAADSETTTPSKRGKAKKAGKEPAADPLDAIPAESPPLAATVSAPEDTSPAESVTTEPTREELPAAETVTVEAVPVAEEVPPVVTPPAESPPPAPIEPAAIDEPTPASVEEVPASSPASEPAPALPAEESVFPSGLSLDLSPLDVIGHNAPPKKRGRPKKKPVAAEESLETLALPGMGDVTPFPDAPKKKGR